MTSLQALLGLSVPVCFRGCHHRCRGLTGTPLSRCPGACPVPTAAQGRTASLLASRTGPVLLGDNHRSEGTLGFASCAQEEGSTRGTRVRGAPLLAIHDGPWADAALHAPQLRCPGPGRFLASPLGLSPSQQQPQCLTPKAPARRSPELPIPICAMSRRDPRHGTARPASHGRARTFHCLPRGRPALLILFSL